jgi:hypothetical protein
MEFRKPFTKTIMAACAAVLMALYTQGCLFSNDKKSTGTPEEAFHGFYTVAFPSIQHRLHLDSTYNVVWTASDSVKKDPVVLTLYQGTRLLANLGGFSIATGSYSWSLPLSRSTSGYRFGSGSDYRLKIMSSVDSTKWDYSQPFTVYSDYSGNISVSSPAAGETAKLDSILAIHWTAGAQAATMVGMQLYKDTVLARTITTSSANSGSYTWTSVRSSLGSGDDYHVRVFSMNDPAISGLSAAFRIASMYSGTITVGSPRAGESLVAGASSQVAWTVTGDPGSTVSIALYRDSTYVSSLSSFSSATEGALSWLVTGGATTSSKYRIKVTSDADQGIYGYSEYFTITGLAPDEYENDGTYKEAKAITVDGKVQKHSITLQDVDWVRFPGTKGKKYLVSVRSDFSLYAYMTDSTGKSLTSSQNGPNLQIVFEPAKSGSLFVRIYSSGSSSSYGPYTVAVTEFDSTQSLFPVTFSSPDSKTTWAAGTSYKIAWTSDSAIYGPYVNLALYNDTLLAQTISTSTFNSGEYSFSIPAGTFTSDKYRIRITSYNNSQIYGYSPYFTISGVTPDAYEPDNAKATAKVLPADGVSQSRNITSGDQDWIRFEAVKGKRYLAVFNSASSIYAYGLDSNGIQLYNSGAQQVYQYGTQFSLAVTPVYGGPHYLRVNPGTGTGGYTVSLLAYDSTLTGFPVKFSSPDTAATWASGSSYVVTWSPDASLFGSYVNMQLWLDSGLVQSVSSSITNSGTYTWFIPSGLVTSNRYRLRLANGSNASIFGFSNYFSISGLAPDTYEPDNARNLAKAIPTDGSAQQRNVTANDSDWVKFAAVTGKSYLVSVNSASASVYLYILDSLGNSLSSQSGSRFSQLFTPTRAGKYYVRVQAYSSYGPYALSVLAYDAGPDGIPVKFSNPDTSTTWSAGSPYPVAWSPDSAVLGTYVTLALYQGDFLIADLSSSTSNRGTTTVTVPAGLATGNNYRIRIASGLNYQIFGFSRKFSIAGIAPDAFEPNDSVTLAKAFTPNSGKQKLSLSYRDRDWFRFDAKAQMLYVFQATSASTLPTSLRLLSNDGATVLLTNVKTGSDSVNSLAWVAPADGKYVLSLEGYNSSSSYYGPYGFEIKEVDPASYKFAVTGPAAGSNVKSGGSIIILWSDPSGVKGLADLFLYNADGVVQTIVANITNAGTYTWTVPAGLPARADYYVKVISRLNPNINGSSGTFTVAP